MDRLRRRFRRHHPRFHPAATTAPARQRQSFAVRPAGALARLPGSRSDLGGIAHHRGSAAELFLFLLLAASLVRKQPFSLQYAHARRKERASRFSCVSITSFPSSGLAPSAPWRWPMPPSPLPDSRSIWASASARWSWLLPPPSHCAIRHRFSTDRIFDGLCGAPRWR